MKHAKRKHKTKSGAKKALIVHHTNQHADIPQSISQKNKLLEASRTLLSIISQLKQNSKLYDAEKLRKHLLNEIDLFQTNAKNALYDFETILVGRYILSVSLDEIINKTTWGKESHWQEHTLLNELKHDIADDDRFFLILEKICHSPNKFVDLIELMYICLSLGYEGKFTGAHNCLQQIVDYVYKTIQIQRVDFEQRLSPSLTKNVSAPSQKTKKNFVSLTTVAVTMLFIAFIYLSLNTFLTIFSSPVNQQLDTITNTSHTGAANE